MQLGELLINLVWTPSSDGSSRCRTPQTGVSSVCEKPRDVPPAQRRSSCQWSATILFLLIVALATTKVDWLYAYYGSGEVLDLNFAWCRNTCARNLQCCMPADCCMSADCWSARTGCLYIGLLVPSLHALLLHQTSGPASWRSGSCLPNLTGRFSGFRILHSSWASSGVRTADQTKQIVSPRESWATSGSCYANRWSLLTIAHLDWQAYHCKIAVILKKATVRVSF